MKRITKIHFYMMLGSCLFWGLQVRGFSSLSEIVKYADVYEEAVVPDNNDYLSPDFTKTYLKRIPSLWNQITDWLFGMQSGYSLSSYKARLAEIVTQRELKGYGYRHILQLYHQKEDILVIWGDLQGAFDSFVRGLVELNKQGILAEDLTLTSPHYFIVLNANAVGISHANLEMLDAAISLMLKNPDQVIYIAGKHEDRELWIDQGLLRQVSVLARLRAAAFGAFMQRGTFEEIKALLGRFFATLPIALYLDYPQDQEPRHRLLQISGFGSKSVELDPAFFGEFFDKAQGTASEGGRLRTYRVQNRIRSKVQAKIRSYIVSVNSATEFEETYGLVELEPVDGATVWSIFSAPTDLNRAVNSFNCDAFVKMYLLDDLQKVYVELYSRDMRTRKPFCQRSCYLLTSGIPVNPDLVETMSVNAVTFGSSLDLSKGSSYIGKSVRVGSSVAMEYLNTKLSEGQRSLRIAFFDDESSPHLTVENLKDIVEQYKNPILCFPITSSVLYNIVDDIAAERVLILFPVAGAPKFFSSKFKGFISLRSSFTKEVHALMQHALRNASGENFCFVYQNDDFGRGALEVAHAILTTLNKKPSVELPLLRGQTDFSNQIKLFKKHEVNAIFFFTSSLSAREFIHQLGITNLIGIQLYGISMLGTTVFKNFITERGLSITCTHVVPNPATSQLAIVKEYREQMDAQGFPYDTLSLEGYMGASLLGEAINTIKGPITKDNISAYFTSFKNHEFKGLKLTFRPEFRDFGQPVWLDTGSAEWVPVHASEDAL